jgi:hypothetical protein
VHRPFGRHDDLSVAAHAVPNVSLDKRWHEALARLRTPCRYLEAGLQPARSAIDSSMILCIGVVRMARSAERDRQAAICSLSVAFARPKCLATEAAEQRR